VNKLPVFFIFSLLFIVNANSQSIKTIHVFVALCDNVHQGIVPVPEFLGKGDEPKSNLYWGAAYGLKTYFLKKDSEWELIRKLNTDKPEILERLLLKHKKSETYLLADAYNGKEIKLCTEDFLKASDRNFQSKVIYNDQNLMFGGNSDLIAYIGHDGLMDFEVNIKYTNQKKEIPVETIILACFSKKYFKQELEKSGAKPLLWTSHLMAPEAYTLKAAIEAWLEKETNEAIRERAAQAYHQYQKCGIKAARNLLQTGF
jgi:hypothetical protein